MLLVRLLFLSLFFCTAHAASESDEFATCQCLGLSKAQTTLESVGATKVNDSCLLFKNICYPPEYGSACKEWPGHQKLFCLIDYQACTGVPFGPSSVFPTLNISYLTCLQNSVKAIKSKQLRTGYITKFSDPYVKAEAYPFEDDAEPGGYSVDLLRWIRNRGNFTLVTTELSETSMAAFPGNPWSACINDLIQDNVDLCCCNLWDTVSRRMVVDFSVPLVSNYFQLLTLLQDGSRGSQFVALFRPFTTGLWVTVLITTLVFMVLMLIVERDADSDFDPSVGWAQNTFHSFYLSFNSLFAGGTLFTPRTIPGKILTLCFGMFVLVLVASFTANLAAQLTASNLKPSIDSISALIENPDAKLCAPDIAVEGIVGLYPPLKERIVQPLHHGNVQEMELLWQGKCDALWAESAAMQYEIAQGLHCNTTLVGQALSPISVAFAVQKDSGYATPLSYLTQQAVSEGIPQTLFTDYFRPEGAIGCGKKEVADEEKFGVASMSGVLLFLGIGAVLAVVGHIGKLIWKRSHPTAKVSPGASETTLVSPQGSRYVDDNKTTEMLEDLQAKVDLLVHELTVRNKASLTKSPPEH
eukprot:TRINITY_DN67118_c13_g3_i1.p1 TRINITY_DN67118_c13_g3~~TRINITY_DN67118_c13_g3_i1.p1  ORF type:complete len:583 (-),score=5.98 TRINITY_DN67118_c13_g3_i1:223-1971(-)